MNPFHTFKKFAEVLVAIDVAYCRTFNEGTPTAASDIDARTKELLRGLGIELLDSLRAWTYPLLPTRTVEFLDILKRAFSIGAIKGAERVLAAHPEVPIWTVSFGRISEVEMARLALTAWILAELRRLLDELGGGQACWYGDGIAPLADVAIGDRAPTPYGWLAIPAQLLGQGSVAEVFQTSTCSSDLAAVIAMKWLHATDRLDRLDPVEPRLIEAAERLSRERERVDRDLSEFFR